MVINHKLSEIDLLFLFINVCIYTCVINHTTMGYYRLFSNRLIIQRLNQNRLISFILNRYCKRYYKSERHCEFFVDNLHDHIRKDIWRRNLKHFGDLKRNIWTYSETLKAIQVISLVCKYKMWVTGIFHGQIFTSWVFPGVWGKIIIIGVLSETSFHLKHQTNLIGEPILFMRNPKLFIRDFRFSLETISFPSETPCFVFET